MPLNKIELVNKEELYCPFCGHKLYPPEYPYCKHTIFAYIEGKFDDCFFDMVTQSFAENYLEKLKNTTHWHEEGFDELGDDDLANFLNGKIGSMSEQTITYFDMDLLEDGIFTEDMKVICYIFRFAGQYPGTVYYGLKDV